ncbi:hypothetical protein N9Y89_02305 [bacterium]|nr:hypothetical protein [bacterium]
MKYKSMGLKDKSLSESDYKRLILEEDTFLKRPLLYDDEWHKISLVVGSRKK